MGDEKMGEPAFPLQDNGRRQDQQGMTLWDYYAAAALTGLCGSKTKYSGGDLDKAVAKAAGVLADAMLAERAKRIHKETQTSKEQTNERTNESPPATIAGCSDHLRYFGRRRGLGCPGAES